MTSPADELRAAAQKIRELATDRGTVPMSELVSIHSFRWSARRAMRRWLEEQSHG